jgi:hypothetical protein
MQIRKQACYEDGHFYSPVVDTADVAARQGEVWPACPQTLGIDWNDDHHKRVLTEWYPRHYARYDYPELLEDSANLTQFYTRNSQFSWMDSRTLFVFLLELKPKRMVEVGSGYSSLLTADVNRRFLDHALDFTCIEPYPRPFLSSGVPGITRLIVERVERAGMAPFEQLEAGDILFIDSSHVSKTGSDVNFLVFEVLPRLKPGVIIHIHDIPLPEDYSKHWVLAENRSWNELYLVRALLMYSTAFRVLFGCHYAFLNHVELMKAALAHPKGHALSGGSIWIERTATR